MLSDPLRSLHGARARSVLFKFVHCAERLPVLRLCCYDVMNMQGKLWTREFVHKLSVSEIVIVFIYGRKARKALHRRCIVPFRNNSRLSYRTPICCREQCRYSVIQETVFNFGFWVLDAMPIKSENQRLLSRRFISDFFIFSVYYVFPLSRLVSKINVLDIVHKLWTELLHRSCGCDYNDTYCVCNACFMCFNEFIFNVHFMRCWSVNFRPNSISFYCFLFRFVYIFQPGFSETCATPPDGQNVNSLNGMQCRRGCGSWYAPPN